MHDILILGAGYAGLSAARRLAAELRGEPVRVRLVNASERFVERVRLHQVAAGQDVRLPSLPRLLRGTGIDLVVGRVAALDPERRRVRLEAAGDSAAGGRELAYDTLVYALGSTADPEGVPGLAEHAHSLAHLAGARALRQRLAGLGPGGEVAVVGGGASGIEAAAEIAESRPGTRVRLVSAKEPGAWLSPRGRAHVRRTLARLGVEVRAGAVAAAIRPDGVELAGGGFVPADAVAWAGGLRVAPLAARSGLAVDAAGRVRTDDTLRSVSHPDVYAIGDAAVMYGVDGAELRMACATGLPAGMGVVDRILAHRRGEPARPFRYGYIVQCVSLGRRDGLIQLVRSDDSPRPAVVTGRPAAAIKEAVCASAALIAQHPGRTLTRLYGGA